MNTTEIPNDVKKLASHVFMRITSFSPLKELGGIEKGWIELKIAEAIWNYHQAKLADVGKTP